MRSEMDDYLNVEHFFIGGMYAKKMTLKNGDTIGKHLHDFTHVSALKSGKVILSVDGVKTEHNAPCFLTIEDGKVHEIQAVTAAEWFCLHITDETDEDKIDHVLIG